MVHWMNRIDMSDYVAEQAYRGRTDEMTDFTFIHKNGRETTRRMTIQKAILLAEYRREDKRYKNFTFYIG